MKKSVISSLLLFVFATFAHAQTPQEINLDEAVDIALENNFQLAVAKNNLDLAGDRVFGEKADFLPSLSANMSGNKSVGRQFIPGTSNFVDDAVNSFRGSLSADLVLFSGFNNINSLRQSQNTQKSHEENVQWVRESIIFETATRFLQVLLDQELLEIAQENLEASLQTLEQVQVQVDVGSRPIVDLYNQEATVANNRLTVTNQQNALELSRLALVRTLQIDPLEQYSFVIPEVDVETVAAPDYNLQQLVATALQNRSDLQREKYNIESIEYQLKVARGQLYPTLSLGASISSGWSDGFILPGDDEALSFNDQFFDARISRSIGLSLSIPIFSGLNRRTNLQTSKINYKNAQLSLEDTRLQVIQEVRQAHSDYQAVIESLEATDAALQAARKAYEAEQARYEVGAGTLIQLSEANAQFVEAQSNRAQAVYNFIFQRKLLDYYLGKLNENISFN